jgi:hypothetical protein
VAVSSTEPNDVDLAMTAPKGKAPQSPNRTILILASYNFSQPAKSFEESVHKMKKPSHNRMHIRPQNAVFYLYLSILATKYERQALTELSMHVAPPPEVRSFESAKNADLLLLPPSAVE